MSGPRAKAEFGVSTRQVETGGLGCCLQPIGALPNRDFSALHYPCHLGKAEPFQATWISPSQGGSQEVAQSQDSEWPGPGWQQPPTVPPQGLSHPDPSCIPWHRAGMGVTSPSRDQLWAVSILLPMLAPGKASGNSHPVSHKAPQGAAWRRARRTELEGAAQSVKFRTEGALEWPLPLVISPKTGVCVVSRGISAENE